jgi:hypothetical protein
MTSLFLNMPNYFTTRCYEQIKCKTEISATAFLLQNKKTKPRILLTNKQFEKSGTQI